MYCVQYFRGRACTLLHSIRRTHCVQYLQNVGACAPLVCARLFSACFFLPCPFYWKSEQVLEKCSFFLFFPSCPPACGAWRAALATFPPTRGDTSGAWVQQTSYEKILSQLSPVMSGQKMRKTCASALRLYSILIKERRSEANVCQMSPSPSLTLAPFCNTSCILFAQSFGEGGNDDK